MKRKRLTDSVSRDELMQMRESGMTNADIARTLDVSVQTIRSYIGNQPGRAPRHTYAPGPVRRNRELSRGGGVVL